jgi:hypothetical protein
VYTAPPSPCFNAPTRPPRNRGAEAEQLHDLGIERIDLSPKGLEAFAALLLIRHAGQSFTA